MVNKEVLNYSSHKSTCYCPSLGYPLHKEYLDARRKKKATMIPIQTLHCLQNMVSLPSNLFLGQPFKSHIPIILFSFQILMKLIYCSEFTSSIQDESGYLSTHRLRFSIKSQHSKRLCKPYLFWTANCILKKIRTRKRNIYSYSLV